MERGQFTFYRSFWEAVKLLPKKDRLPVLEAFISYGLDGQEPESLTQTQTACFMLAKPILKNGRSKAENGKLGGRPKANLKQTESKIENEIKIKKKINTQTENDRGKAGGCVSVEDFFEDFWKMYPVKVGREEAYALWQELKLGEREYRQIMASISAWEKTPRWQNEGGRYIPHPAKFLSAGYWRNVPQPPAQQEIPKGVSAELGQAELENIHRLFREAGSDGSAAGGGYSDLSDVRPQAPCKRATGRSPALSESLWPRSADDAAAPSARKLPGTATGGKQASQ